MNPGEILINIRSESTGFARNQEVIFEFHFDNNVFTHKVTKENVKNEQQREFILIDIARKAAVQLIAPKLVNTMLNSLVSAALKGENPLD